MWMIRPNFSLENACLVLMLCASPRYSGYNWQLLVHNFSSSFLYYHVKFMVLFCSCMMSWCFFPGWYYSDISIFNFSDQDSVRLLAVEGCAALGKLLEPQDCVAHILPVIVSFSQVGLPKHANPLNPIWLCCFTEILCWFWQEPVAQWKVLAIATFMLVDQVIFVTIHENSSSFFILFGRKVNIT